VHAAGFIHCCCTTDEALQKFRAVGNLLGTAVSGCGELCGCRMAARQRGEMREELCFPPPLGQLAWARDRTSVTALLSRLLLAMDSSSSIRVRKNSQLLALGLVRYADQLFAPDASHAQPRDPAGFRACFVTRGVPATAGMVPQAPAVHARRAVGQAGCQNQGHGGGCASGHRLVPVAMPESCGDWAAAGPCATGLGRHACIRLARGCCSPSVLGGPG